MMDIHKIEYSPEHFKKAQRDIEEMNLFPAPWNNAIAYAAALRAEVERMRGENDNLLAVIETEKQIMTTLSQTESDLAAAVEVLRELVKREYQASVDWGSRLEWDTAYDKSRAFLARLEVK
jgi:hypothetical protein